MRHFPLTTKHFGRQNGHMSVRLRFDGHNAPCLVTTNTEGRRPIFRSEPAIRVLLGVMGEVRRDTGLEIFGWVVMPDHVHLVARAPSPLTMGRDAVDQGALL